MIRFTCKLCKRSDRERSFGKPSWCGECYKLRWDFYDAYDAVTNDLETPFDVFQAAIAILHTDGLGPAMRHVTDHLAATSK